MALSEPLSCFEPSGAKGLCDRDAGNLCRESRRGAIQFDSHHMYDSRAKPHIVTKQIT
jgi:hypothetical protein